MIPSIEASSVGGEGTRAEPLDDVDEADTGSLDLLEKGAATAELLIFVATKATHCQKDKFYI